MKNLILYAITTLGLFLFAVTSVSAQIPAYKSWLVNGQNLYTLAPYIGIGTQNPIAKLSIEGGGISIGGTPQQGIWNSKVPLGNAVGVVDPYSESGGYSSSSITIAPDGVPVISYNKRGPQGGGIQVARCGLPGCTIAMVDGVDGMPSVTTGGEGNPVIAYSSYSSGSGLKIAWCGTPDCSANNTITVLDPNGAEGSVSITGGFAPIIAYSGENNSLKIAGCSSNRCQGATIHTIDVGGGAFPSIALSVDGSPIISYEGNGSLKVALARWCEFPPTPECPFPPGYNISISTVDPAGGSGSSITIGSDNLPVISYVAGTTVKVAKCGNLDCSANNSITTIGSSAIRGESTSISLGTNGMPIIVYTMFGTIWNGPSYNEIRFVRCGVHACTMLNTNVALDRISRSWPTGFRASGPSVAVGSDGLPLVSYMFTVSPRYQGTWQEHRLAHCGSDRCIPYWTRR